MGNPSQTGESVRLPNQLPGISIKKINGGTYVYYTYERVPVPGRNHTAPKNISIGKVDPDRPGYLIPNKNFRKFFPGGFPGNRLRVEQAPEEPAPEVQNPEVQIPEVQIPEAQTPDVPAPEEQTPEVQPPEEQTPEIQPPEKKAPKKPSSKNRAPKKQTAEVPAPREWTPDVPPPREWTPDVPPPREWTPDVPPPREWTPDVPPPEETRTDILLAVQAAIGKAQQRTADLRTLLAVLEVAKNLYKNILQEQADIRLQKEHILALTDSLPEDFPVLEGELPVVPSTWLF